VAITRTSAERPREQVSPRLNGRVGLYARAQKFQRMQSARRTSCRPPAPRNSTRAHDALRCHFDDDAVPKLIRPHFLRDEVAAALSPVCLPGTKGSRQGVSNKNEVGQRRGYEDALPILTKLAMPVITRSRPVLAAMHPRGTSSSCRADP